MHASPIPDTVAHGAFLGWPPAWAAGWPLTAQPEECAIPFSTRSGTRPKACRVEERVSSGPAAVPHPSTLGIHGPALAVQRLGDPAIPVEAMRQGQPMQRIAQVGLFLARR